MSADKKEELGQLLTDLGEDINDRMENLIAIKGEKFSEAVSIVLGFHSLMQIAGAKNIPEPIRKIITLDLSTNLMGSVMMSLLGNAEDAKEAVHFAKNISDTMDQNAAKLMTILKGDQE